MPASTTLSKVLKLAQAFVTDKGGEWNHQDWEALCGELSKVGVENTDANRAALGSLLESLKYFSALPAAAATPKKSAPKAKKKAAS